MIDRGLFLAALMAGALVLSLFGILFLDARAFADECIRAGGYVAAPQACVR